MLNSNAARLLVNAARGDLHHSLVLHGPSSEVLRESAYAIARTLTCNAGGADECTSCARVNRGIHPDVHLIDVAEDRKLITVEQVRSIVSGATLRPFEGRCNVFIIDGADAMSTGGANALLKTLEEPAGASVFILLTRSPELLLPTIRSRSQVLPIRDDPRGNAAQIAASQKVSVQVARVMAEHPALSAGDVAAFLNIVIDGIHEWVTRRDASALLSIAAAAGTIEPASEMLSVLGETLRDLAALPAQQTVNPEAVAVIREQLSTSALLRAGGLSVRAAGRLVVNIDARLAVEQVLAELLRTEY